jgi:hypothetical protein
MIQVAVLCYISRQPRIVIIEIQVFVVVVFFFFFFFFPPCR